MCISAIAGDIIGSVYEFHNDLPFDINHMFFNKSVFTDDTVLMAATADVLLHSGSFVEKYLEYALAYPSRGYGGGFSTWCQLQQIKATEPYNSYGNGSAMRIAPVGWACDTVSGTLELAKKSAEVTHNHEQGILGAQAVALSIFLARNHATKAEIMHVMSYPPFNYDIKTPALGFPKGFFETCQESLPRCLAVFNESASFEEAMLLSYKMGGDMDTNNAIIGGICDAFYGLPSRYIVEEVYMRLARPLADIATEFIKEYIDEKFVEPETACCIASTAEEAFNALFGRYTTLAEGGLC